MQRMVVLASVGLTLLISFSFSQPAAASPGIEQPPHVTTPPQAAPGEERSIGIELGILIPYTLMRKEGEYTEQLETFFFEEKPSTLPRTRLLLTFGVTYDVYDFFTLGLQLERLDQRHYERESPLTRWEDVHYDFTWQTFGASIFARMGPRLGDSGRLFVELGVGPAVALSRYVSKLETPETRVAGFEPANTAQAHWGHHQMVGVGGYFMPRREAGVFFRAIYFRAPVLKNLVGDVHDSGGVLIFMGARFGV